MTRVGALTSFSPRATERQILRAPVSVLAMQYRSSVIGMKRTGAIGTVRTRNTAGIVPCRTRAFQLRDESGVNLASVTHRVPTRR
jgi:hypothetical protein